jgi:hypothetical protein
MSAFREALKTLGHGEWKFETSSTSGMVSATRLREDSPVGDDK